MITGGAASRLAGAIAGLFLLLPGTAPAQDARDVGARATRQLAAGAVQIASVGPQSLLALRPPAQRPAVPVPNARALNVQSQIPQLQTPRSQNTVGRNAPDPQSGIRPEPRPVSAQRIAFMALPQTGATQLAPLAGPRPQPRSDALMEQVLFGRLKRRRGSVCGNIDIQGEEAGDIVAQTSGCGARDAVRVTSVSGVTLSQPALMTCDTARALNRWVDEDVKTAFGRRNKVAGLRVAAHYSCRPRNNRPGARISEHGKARAIDISGFTLENGHTVTVLRGWRDSDTQKSLRKIWKAACGPFGTVLGPSSDPYHQDHLHLDTARYRSGAYCR